MVNDDSEELKTYIKKELEKGFSKKEVEDALLDAGHSKEALIDVLREIEEPEEIESEKPKIAIKPVIITLVILIIIVGGIYSIRFLPKVFKETKSREKAQSSEEWFAQLVKGQMEKCLVEQREIDTRCMAILKEDVELCEHTEPQARCYDEYYAAEGTLKQNPNSCDKVNDINRKELCMILSGKNIEVCTEKEGDAKILCNALIKEELVLCEDITQKRMMEICKDFINFRGAHESSDVVICNNIQNNFWKTVCSAVVTKDESSCWLGEPEICKDLVYFREVYLELPELDTRDIAKILGTS